MLMTLDIFTVYNCDKEYQQGEYKYHLKRNVGDLALYKYWRGEKQLHLKHIGGNLWILVGI